MASVRMLKTAAGPDGPYVEGQVYEVHPDTAVAWVGAGACVIVAEAPRTAVAAEPTPRAEPKKSPPKRKAAKKKAK